MKTAVVVGRAAGVMDEYRAARAMSDFDYNIVVGKVGEVFPERIDYWASFHVNLFDKWANTRATNGHPPAANFCGAFYRGNKLGVDRKGRVATIQRPLHHVRSVGGSSGFLALKGVALDLLGCDRVVLVGCPMTAAGAHDASCLQHNSEIDKDTGQPKLWDEADKYWKTWLEHMDELRPRVRSMSGRTADALGHPTQEWFCGTEGDDDSTSGGGTPRLEAAGDSRALLDDGCVGQGDSVQGAPTGPDQS